MIDLDRKILNLKVERKSLRQIGEELNLSHMTVSRRLRKIGQKTGSNVTEDMATTSSHDVTCLDTSRRGPHRGKNESDFLSSDNLVSELLRFLEGRGAEVYRMQNGGFQIKTRLVTVRFYISRRSE